MSRSTVDPDLDTTNNFALISFLARCKGDTLRAYKKNLRVYLRWCAQRDLQPLQACRPHLELYVRWLEDRGYALATIGRRLHDRRWLLPLRRPGRPPAS